MIFENSAPFQLSTVLQLLSPSVRVGSFIPSRYIRCKEQDILLSYVLVLAQTILGVPKIKDLTTLPGKSRSLTQNQIPSTSAEPSSFCLKIILSPRTALA